MFIAYTPEQQALKDRVSNYFRDFITEDLIEEKKDPELFEGGGPVFRAKMKQLAADAKKEKAENNEPSDKGADAEDAFDIGDIDNIGSSDGEESDGFDFM